MVASTATMSKSKRGFGMVDWYQWEPSGAVKGSWDRHGEVGVSANCLGTHEVLLAQSTGRNCIGIDDGLGAAYQSGVLPADDFASRFMLLFSATFSLLHRRIHSQGFNLTPEGRGLLLHMSWAGPLTIGELALHTDRAQSVVSETVAVLESHDLVARVRDPRDRRRTLVWLSVKARKWLAEEQEPLDRERTQAVLSAMDPSVRQALMESYANFIEIAERTRPSSARSPLDEVPTNEPKRSTKKGKAR